MFVVLQLLCSAAGYAISWDYILTLRFRKSEEYFFTHSECPFELNIENVSPDKVSVYVNDVPGNVSFMSSRKETYIPADSGKSGRHGTHLVIYFRFDETGDYHIRPVEVRIDGSYCRIPVEPVYVYDNPSIVQPQLSIQFDTPDINVSGKKITAVAGQHISFTLFLRYAAQIVDYTWTIPEDSIFAELEHYEIAEGLVHGAEFSPKSVPVAKFDWQPLVHGDYELPKVHILATTYGGLRTEVPFPSYKVTVTPSTQKAAGNAGAKSVFPYAFNDQAVPGKEKSPYGQDFTLAEKIHALRVKERHSFPLVSKAGAVRRRAEKSAGLVPGRAEPSLALLFLVIALATVALVLYIVFLVRKNKLLRRIMLSLTLAAGVGALVLGAQTGNVHAVFAGGMVSSIPEEKKSDVTVRPGVIVNVIRTAGDWVYVSYNDTKGWVPKETVLVIK